jgi:hypothetical protein
MNPFHMYHDFPDLSVILVPSATRLHRIQANYNFTSFNFSAAWPTASAAGLAAAAIFGSVPLSAFAFAFWEVESLGSSLVNGMKSTAPGRYLRLSRLPGQHDLAPDDDLRLTEVQGRELHLPSGSFQVLRTSF